jgi:hypothetical protein
MALRARRPRKEATPEEKAEEIQSLRMKFFILTHVGGLMIVFSSIHPFFAAHQIPAFIILTSAAIFDRWKSARKGQKRILAYVCLLAAFFIGFNALYGWFTPIDIADAAPPRFPVPTFISSELTLTFGYIGHMIVMFGVFMALQEIRLNKSLSNG